MLRLNWREWKDEEPEELLSCGDSGFVPMGDVPYRDVLWAQEGQGIYVFHDKNWVPYYIGKCTGRTFLGRISAHLDTHYHKGGSAAGWFNTFQKRWVQHFGVTDREAKEKYLDECGMIILEMPVDPAAVGALEKYLIHLYNPILNRSTTISSKSKFAYMLDSSKGKTCGEIFEGVNRG